MTINTKLHPFAYPNHISTDSQPALVRDGVGYRLPLADAYARRIAEEAEAWLDHARERSRMRDATLVAKAIHAVAFTMRHRAHDFAVPSKLIGTSKHQAALWAMVKGNVGLGTPLDVEEVATDKRPRLLVSYEGAELGEVQSKHAPWLRRLLAEPFGARVFLVRVTGQESDYTLGCNVAFGRVGSAVAALNHALGHGDGADAYGGDELPEGNMKPVVHPVPSQHPVPHEGDGADWMTPLPTPSMEEVIRFWRDERGSLNMNIPHVIRHSPTGPEVGYNGSGPADAALSVLSAVTSREEAERLYQVYKHEVIARMDASGGAVTRASVRRWLAVQRDDC